jgi:hypothetical protein
MKRFKNLGLWALIVMIPMLALSLFAGPAAAAIVAFKMTPTHFMVVGATLGANMVTMADYAKLLGPDDRLAPIIEMLNVKNSILDDIPWQEGNMTTGHRVVVEPVCRQSCSVSSIRVCRLPRAPRHSWMNRPHVSRHGTKSMR